MKKSLLTIITFALVLVNLVLTAVMALTIVPEVNNVNTLIAKISEAIDLDISSGDEINGGANVSIDKIAPYNISSNLTINLKKDEDGKDHFAVLAITLSLNTASEAYATYNADTLITYEGVIRGEINKTVSSYTIEEIKQDTTSVQDDIKSKLNTLFGSDLVAGVSFSSATYQ